MDSVIERQRAATLYYCGAEDEDDDGIHSRVICGSMSKRLGEIGVVN